MRSRSPTGRIAASLHRARLVVAAEDRPRGCSIRERRRAPTPLRRGRRPPAAPRSPDGTIDHFTSTWPTQSLPRRYDRLGEPRRLFCRRRQVDVVTDRPPEGSQRGRHGLQQPRPRHPELVKVRAETLQQHRRHGVVMGEQSGAPTIVSQTVDQRTSLGSQRSPVATVSSAEPQPQFAHRATRTSGSSRRQRASAAPFYNARCRTRGGTSVPPPVAMTESSTARGRLAAGMTPGLDPLGGRLAALRSANLCQGG